MKKALHRFMPAEGSYFMPFKKLFRRNLQSLTYIKQHMNRNFALCCFNSAHMGSAYINHFSELTLRISSVLSVKRNIQP